MMRGLLLIVAGMLCLLCGCAQEEPAPVPRQKVYFSHYWSFEGVTGEGMARVVAGFNDLGGPYELIGNPLDHEAFKTAIVLELGSGAPVDLYSYWAGMRTASVASMLLPIDDIWTEENLDGKYPVALIDSAVTYNGRKVFLPITQHLVAFFYNKRLFERFGLAPPASWEEFLRVCQTLKSHGVTPLALGARSKWPAQFWFDYLLLRTAGPQYRQNLVSGRARYTDPEVVRAFALWRELVDKGYFNSDPNSMDWDTGAGQLLVDGQAAMTLMGSWLTGYFSSDAIRWEAGRDYDIFAFPVVDQGVANVVLGPVDGLIIPRDARNPAGAKEVLRYFSRLEVQQGLSIFSGNIVPRSGVEESVYTEAQKRMLPLVHGAGVWAFNYDLATEPAEAELGLTAFAEFLAFPDLTPEILAKLDSRVRSLPRQ
jgi:multiple sugar transport system substrate-binding protein/raffinose/stachyose/melibiose transport system substrate-binding protein